MEISCEIFVSHISPNKQGIHCLFNLIFKVNFIFIAAWHKYCLLNLHEPTCSLLVPLATADEGGRLDSMAFKSLAQSQRNGEGAHEKWVYSYGYFWHTFVHFRTQFEFLNRSASLCLGMIHGVMCNTFPECHKDDFTTRKEMSQNWQCYHEIFLRENIMCLIYNYRLIMLNQFVIRLGCLPASSSDFNSTELTF